MPALTTLHNACYDTLHNACYDTLHNACSDYSAQCLL